MCETRTSTARPLRVSFMDGPLDTVGGKNQTTLIQRRTSRNSVTAPANDRTQQRGRQTWLQRCWGRNVTAHGTASREPKSSRKLRGTQVLVGKGAAAPSPSRRPLV